ncbi:tRNA (adenosine(37)-N6)-threonylcarbamoyltransferase complex dimerization subunit type 1 TsaB [soil metagenome]
MIVLAVDTALGACQAVLLAGDGAPVVRSVVMDRGHQERLAPLVAELFEEAGLRPSGVERIGVTVGPGSFTGLRVGLAFAKGFGLGIGAPPVGIGTLQALALGAQGRVASVISAPHDRCYLQLFDGALALSRPDLLSWKEAADLCRAGGVVEAIGPGAADLAERLPALAVDSRLAPDPARLAAHLATLAAPFAPAAPLYLREPDAKTIAERAALKALAATAP